MLNTISVVQFLPHRTDAHIRVTKRYPVTAWHIVKAFDKMDFIINTEFNPAKLLSTRQTGKVLFASCGVFQNIVAYLNDCFLSHVVGFSPIDISIAFPIFNLSDWYFCDLLTLTIGIRKQ